MHDNYEQLKADFILNIPYPNIPVPRYEIDYG